MALDICKTLNKIVRCTDLEYLLAKKELDICMTLNKIVGRAYFEYLFAKIGIVFV
jgi:hypothetical protein